MRIFLSAIAAAGLVLPPTQGNAEQRTWSTVGALQCVMEPSIGLVMVSRQQARCAFRSSVTGATEVYTGRMELPGPDMILTGGKLVWIVLAPASYLSPKSLSGRYSGMHEDITVGEASDAAAALCSDSRGVICLQPLAEADHEDGNNLAVGVSSVRLE